MRGTLIVAIALLAGVSVAGCAATVAGQAVAGSGQITTATPPASTDPSATSGAGTTDPPSTEPSSSVSSSPESSSSGASSTDSPSGSAKTPETMFGQPLTLGKGIVVTVAAGTPYTPSVSAAVGHGSRHYLQFAFTVANHTATAFKLSDVDAATLSGGTVGELVFDSPNVGAPPDKTLAANQSATFTLALGANDPADVTLQVRVSYDDPAGLVLSKPPSAAPKSTAPASSGPLPFGRTHRFPTGLAVTTAKPVPCTPSVNAVYKKAKAYVAVVVTVANGTGAPFSLSDMDEDMSSDNTDGDSVADDDISSGSPDFVLPNAATVTFTMAFGVLDPSKLQFSIAPTYDDDPGVFTTG